MDIGYSLIAGLLVILLLFVLVYFSDLTGVVTSWITWCRDIYHIRSLPSPPGRWFWGNALEVSRLYRGVLRLRVFSCKANEI